MMNHGEIERRADLASPGRGESENSLLPPPDGDDSGELLQTKTLSSENIQAFIICMSTFFKTVNTIDFLSHRFSISPAI